MRRRFILEQTGLLDMGTDLDLKKYDLNLLIIFESIYACSNISQAAIQLGMSQPTVSNALGRLRLQVGDPLFVRSDKGVEPTPYAQNLITPVRDALAALRAGFQPIRHFDPRVDERTFRLAMHGFTATTVLPPLLNDLTRSAPNIRVDFVPQAFEKPYDELVSGKIDLAIDSFDEHHPQITLEPVAQVKAICIARKGHSFISGTLTSQDFCRAGHVAMRSNAHLRNSTDSVIVNAGLERRVVCEVGNTTDLAPIVAGTDLIAIVPRPYAMMVADRYDLQVLQLPFAYPQRKLFIANLASRDVDLGIKWLHGKLRELLIIPNTPDIVPVT